MPSFKEYSIWYFLHQVLLSCLPNIVKTNLFSSFLHTLFSYSNWIIWLIEKTLSPVHVAFLKECLEYVLWVNVSIGFVLSHKSIFVWSLTRVCSDFLESYWTSENLVHPLSPSKQTIRTKTKLKPVTDVSYQSVPGVTVTGLS